MKAVAFANQLREQFGELVSAPKEALGEVAVTLGKALGFLVGALGLGVWLAPRLFSVASRLQAPLVLLAWMASRFRPRR